MDLARIDIRLIEENRLDVSLRLHVLAVARILHLPKAPAAEKNSALAEPIFSATIGASQPRLGGDLCEWRKPALRPSGDADFLLLHVIATCLNARPKPFSLDLPLSFLRFQPAAFQLVTRLEGAGDPILAVASPPAELLHLGTQNSRGFLGFLRMGMGHIGALPEEWRDPGDGWRFPEGIDHILFVLALIVGGGTIWGIVQCISGFTLGHSITLALATFQIIHIHSRWVEACIALSIAYVAASALIRPRSGHRWVVAALFGIVHGLGFASALQDLELSRTELLPALFGFNIGVELGQGVILLFVLPALWLLRRRSAQIYLWTMRLMAVALVAVGSYWFILRAVD
jgi:hypothetical protein